MLPEAPARNISTATKAQKMLATQMQVLNSRAPSSEEHVARRFDHPGWAVLQCLGGCHARDLLWIQATVCWAQSKLQEQDYVRVGKFMVHDWKWSLFWGAQESWGQARCHLHAALSAPPGSRRELWFGLEPSQTHQNELTATVCATLGPWGFHISGRVPISDTTQQSPALPTWT